MGGPEAFGLKCEYKCVSEGVFEEPKSVWEMFGETGMEEVIGSYDTKL